MLSVIIPAYDEEEMIPVTYGRIRHTMEDAGISHELIFVDDGSEDKTWEEIRRLAEADGNVRGVHFSRHFGKEAAIFAGLKKAAGDASVVIDADLQMPPEKIAEMYRLWEEGYEVVEGIKEGAGEESDVRRHAADAFYQMISRSVGMDMTESSDFKLLDRKVVDALNGIKEQGVFFRALSFWVGFKRTSVRYAVEPRSAGKTKWSYRSLTRYAIRNLSTFTSAPLHIITILGVLMLITALVFGTIALVQKLAGTALGGFTTVIVLLLFIGSLIMISLGIIGYYIARIFEEMKGRPRYIISDTCGQERSFGDK